MRDRKREIGAAMAYARERTLWLLSQVPEDFLRCRVHSFYSPVGWHFGHIGRTEEAWVLSEAARRPPLDERYDFLFADRPDNPKENRVNLPSRREIIDYLHAVRKAVLDLLESTDVASSDPFLADGYAWEFALQHECQHQETICELLQLIQKVAPAAPTGAAPEWVSGIATEFANVSGGSFLMGSDERHVYDNEKRQHQVEVSDFKIARTPVTAYQWSKFIEEGGYHRPELWCEEGWDWRCVENATMPEYWEQVDGRYVSASPIGRRFIHPDEPASALSWFEADAYARWAGMRLPTEEEWEYAARGPDGRTFPWGSTPPVTEQHACFGMTTWSAAPVGSHPKGAGPFGTLDMAGGVWEWTSSPFLPYPGFEAFPYDGYSKDHLKGFHRVCRGGSWASSGPILRCSFRNWYVPTYRQGFLGLRLAL